MAGQHRSTQRHGGKVVDIEEPKLRQRLREIAAEHIRWGRRMAYRLLRREGWSVNHQRLPGPSVHPVRQRAGIHRPSPTSPSTAPPGCSLRTSLSTWPIRYWRIPSAFKFGVMFLPAVLVFGTLKAPFLIYVGSLWYGTAGSNLLFSGIADDQCAWCIIGPVQPAQCLPG